MVLVVLHTCDLGNDIYRTTRETDKSFVKLAKPFKIDTSLDGV